MELNDLFTFLFLGVMVCFTIVMLVSIAQGIGNSIMTFIRDLHKPNSSADLWAERGVDQRRK